MPAGLPAALSLALDTVSYEEIAGKTAYCLFVCLFVCLCVCLCVCSFVRSFVCLLKHDFYSAGHNFIVVVHQPGQAAGGEQGGDWHLHIISIIIIITTFSITIISSIIIVIMCIYIYMYTYIYGGYRHLRQGQLGELVHDQRLREARRWPQLCIYIYIYIYTHTYVRTYIHTCIGGEFQQ